MDDKSLPVLFLMGPTASGKTDLVRYLFDAFDIELISVDAAQVYWGMDIGTAKPDDNFLSRYPHHLIDICSPNCPYSAAKFREDALALIDQIQKRRKLPVLVGGTMFYFSVLERGLSDLPVSDELVRRKMTEELQSRGLASLYTELTKVDHSYGKRIRPTDTQRILRALEIYRLTGLPPSSVMAESPSMSGLTYPLVKLTLFTSSRCHLHKRITDRFKSMIAHGLIEETQILLENIDNPDHSPSMRIVGYRQVYDYLRHRTTREEMIEQAIAATRQLAKKQLTWLRQQSNVVWFDTRSTEVLPAISHYLKSNSLTVGYSLKSS